LAALAIVCLPRLAQSQTPATAWGYMSGSENLNADDSATVPGSRSGGATWTDQSGNFWLFGGYGFDSTGNQGYLNDLWEYSGGTWSLKSGITTVPGNGLCNESNYTAGTIVVGGRSSAASWVDASGNLWLFGGDGCGKTSTTPGFLNDLWMYNIAAGKWTFEGGDQTTGQTGVYGLQHDTSATYLPGAREQAVAWTDSNGNFWLFGGSGVSSTGASGSLNDLWEFNPTTKDWTWVSGSLTADPTAVYGTQGTASATSVPGGRGQATGVADSGGNLWLFGGFGHTTNGGVSGSLNDLWEFDTTTLEWTWVSGSNTLMQQGSYGTEYVTAGGQYPGARNESNLWIDKAGNLWLFGGYAYDSTDTYGPINDLWEFDVPTSQWTWAGGDKTTAAAQTPVYGTEGTPAIANIPGGRSFYGAWNDGENNFWLFGGEGYNPSTNYGLLNDLWEAIPPTPTPAFSLAAGTYQGSQTLTITDALGGAAIYYTTDGTAPTTSSTAYAGPITVSKTELVQAIAIVTGRSQSLVRAAEYIVVPQTAITWETPAPIVYGTPLSSVQLDATTSIPGSFDYTPAAGTVLAVGTQTLSVTFTPTDPSTAGFQAATATVTLTVTAATPTITWANPAAIAYGTALSATQLDATATFDGNPVTGSYVYKSETGATVTVGTVLAAGTHTLTVTFTPSGLGASNYTTATASVTLVVTADTPTITWAQPASIAYGTALSATQLDATATFGGVTVPGTFVYSPAAGTVLTVGTQTLSVTFTPTNTTDYTTVQASTIIVVTQATPIINWQAPAAINYGTALSSVQLDATASVPGAFVYSPVAGTVLAAGAQTLSVTFTPSDVIDYATVSATVPLTVLASNFTISGSPTGQTVYAGYSTDFVITVTPVNGPFNNAVTLSVTGLPSGATGTFAQPTLTPGSSAVSTTLSVAVSSSTTKNQPPASPFGNGPRALAPLMALLLLLPLRRVRKAAGKLSLLLILAVSLGAMLSMTACGTPGTKTINWQDEFVLTVTGTGGGSTQTAQLVLTVE
jgi:N-acetylneuraminic acid mutarotase